MEKEMHELLDSSDDEIEMLQNLLNHSYDELDSSFDDDFDLLHDCFHRRYNLDSSFDDVVDDDDELLSIPDVDNDLRDPSAGKTNS